MTFSVRNLLEKGLINKKGLENILRKFDERITSLETNTTSSSDVESRIATLEEKVANLENGS